MVCEWALCSRHGQASSPSVAAALVEKTALCGPAIQTTGGRRTLMKRFHVHPLFVVRAFISLCRRAHVPASVFAVIILDFLFVSTLSFITPLSLLSTPSSSLAFSFPPHSPSSPLSPRGRAGMSCGDEGV